jgi:hypothetical protein
MIIKRSSAILCLVLGTTGAVPLGAQTGSALTVGETFPDLVLPSLRDGTPTSLAQFRGQKVILHVFASW